jgi:glycosyltransferase involved in cell wall biosynthesis
MTNNNVSVVIATLGEVSLKKTIESLNNSSIVPKEILICIPSEYAKNTRHYNYSNIKIIKTTVRGQVAQRVVGFQNAKYPFVLQLDDDITLDFYCIEKLLESVISKKNIAVGPKLFDHLTKEYHSFLIPTNTKLVWFNKMFYFFANGKSGFQPGIISKSGINFGIPETPNTFHDVDWLSGGCLMHRKENLILTNYFPCKGKAYAEDLFHSKLLRDNNVILVRSGEAKCYVDFTSSKGGGWLNIIRNISKPLVPMKIFVKSINGSIIHLYFITFLFYVRLLLMKTFK